MALASYVYQGKASYGILRDDCIVDVPSHWKAAPATLLDAIQAGADAMARIASLAEAPGGAVPIVKVKLLAPLPQPPKLIGLAVNYVEHHNEYDRGHALPDDPKFHTTPRPFLMPSTCVIGAQTNSPLSTAYCTRTLSCASGAVLWIRASTG